jgi:hypothetical protein
MAFRSESLQLTHSPSYNHRGHMPVRELLSFRIAGKTDRYARGTFVPHKTSMRARGWAGLRFNNLWKMHCPVKDEYSLICRKYDFSGDPRWREVEAKLEIPPGKEAVLLYRQAKWYKENIVSYKKLIQ